MLTSNICQYFLLKKEKLLQLVNVSLKFKMLTSNICQYFLLKKEKLLQSHFFNKNISVFGNKVVKHLTS